MLLKTRQNIACEKDHVVRQNGSLDKLFAKLLLRIRERTIGSPFIVGINGIDASGKTVFSKELSRFLLRRGYRVQLIHVDDFHNAKNVATKGTAMPKTTFTAASTSSGSSEMCLIL
jgi:phosphoglycolate phosphatase